MKFPSWRALLPIAAASFLAAPLVACGGRRDRRGAVRRRRGHPGPAAPLHRGHLSLHAVPRQGRRPPPAAAGLPRRHPGRFNHGAPDRWCLDCHDNANRDLLHLTNGKKVPFTESYKLCGQCHGDKYRDWKVGVHGKRIGIWNGKKTYFLCVNCHNPHYPRFKALKPEPPPIPPQEQGR